MGVDVFFVIIFVVSFVIGNIPPLLVLYFVSKNQTKKQRSRVFIGYFLISVPIFLFLLLSIISKSV